MTGGLQTQMSTTTSTQNRANRERADRRGTRIVNPDLSYDCEGNITGFPIYGEQWRKIPNFSAYMFSNLGRVMRVERRTATWPGNILKGYKNKDGYIRVNIDRHGHGHFIHNLVANAFIGPCPEGMEVNHKDRNKENNRVENLEYVTHHENMLHAKFSVLGMHPKAYHKKKLTAEEVITIRTLYAKGIKAKLISEIIGVDLDISAYCRIGRGETYEDVLCGYREALMEIFKEAKP